MTRSLLLMTKMHSLRKTIIACKLLLKIKFNKTLDRKTKTRGVKKGNMSKRPTILTFVKSTVFQ